MSKVVPLSRFPLRFDVELDLEAVVRADRNPAVVYAAERMLAHPELAEESAPLTATILALLEGREVAVMLTALYTAVEIVSASWIAINGDWMTRTGRWPKCAAQSGEQSTQSQGASTPSPRNSTPRRSALALTLLRSLQRLFSWSWLSRWCSRRSK